MQDCTHTQKQNHKKHRATESYFSKYKLEIHFGTEVVEILVYEHIYII